MMVGSHRIDADELQRTTSELLERIQRIESEQAKLRAKLEGDRQLRFLIANISSGAAVAPEIGMLLNAHW